MKLFSCPACGQTLDFENTRCERCGRRLGYEPARNELLSLDPGGDDAIWRPAGTGAEDRPYRFCANAEQDACNWLVPAESGDRYCLACRHNRTIPHLGESWALSAWQRMEGAKRRLFYTLLRFDLPRPAAGEADEPLVFDFLADNATADGPKVMTGHDEGLITIALAEADDAEREKRRASMGEPYRTLLGHFRHEVGHFYWDVLVRDTAWLVESRALFGDDRQDYAAALQRHYAEGPPPDWRESFISAYATTHPWEDFAESWAHYLHIVDTLEMATSLKLRLAPDGSHEADVAGSTPDVYAGGEFRPLVETWIPLAFGTNALNRCMGQKDLYPFVLTPTVQEKLGFIHRLVHDQRGQGGATAPVPADLPSEPAPSGSGPLP